MARPVIIRPERDHGPFSASKRRGLRPHFVRGVRLVLVSLGLLEMTASSAATPIQERPARLDHGWIVASPGAARELAALRTIGFTVAPKINRHVGQGTASATVEFENGFLELIWPDAAVPINNVGGRRARDRFVERMEWRTNGVSPFGIALSRTSRTPASFPFETWEVRAEWMEEGKAMVMMTPRGSAAVHIALHAGGTDEVANLRSIASDAPSAAAFRHANGARRLTKIKIIAPTSAGLPASTDFAVATGAVEFAIGSEWLMEMTLDAGRSGQHRDLRPTLPLTLSW